MPRIRTAKKGKRATRQYSPSTLKLLFGLSGNECAHPECSNTLIEAATDHSDDRVVAHICHIHALSETGPRFESALTSEQLNSPENLILLCAHHHAIVDAQYESYPAERLKEWKKHHEERHRRRVPLESASVQPSTFSRTKFPRTLVDQEVNRQVDKLRKSRLFDEFDRINSALVLGRRLVDGELSGGSDDVRCKALAWCARVLSRCEEAGEAREMLDLARKLDTGPDIDIADAFCVSQEGEKATSLRILAEVDTPSSRSAALMVVAHHDGAEGAIQWMRDTGMEATELDSDGKSFLLAQLLKLAKWNDSFECLGAISANDFEETPILWHVVAITRLLSAVPAELRARVLNYVPFNVSGFPLASDAVAMESRKTSHACFVRAMKIAQELECPRAARIDDEYALWLELKDPAQLNSGKRRLESMLRDPNTALGVVHLGLDLGVKLDVAMVERDIEREIARNGGMTTEAATARFALAFAQKTPERVAAYLARHQDQLATRIDKKMLLFRQVEMLARAGLAEKANRCLDQLIVEGITDQEEDHLRHLVAQAQGRDPIEARKQQFGTTDSLGDLMSLVKELESGRHWDDVCEYGRTLFERTGSLDDAEGLARALSGAHRYNELVQFLDDNRYLLSQSTNLKLRYAWSLFEEGALVQCRAFLEKLGNNLENPNVRALRVDLAISLGDSGAISSFVAEEHQQREARTARELLRAAHLALLVESPHGRELVSAAVESEGDDAEILAAAYFLASRAGWEGDAQVFGWLQRAADLSDDGGPLQRLDLQDVLEQKREWNRQESETWEQLARGATPMFVAARSLNRSLVGLTVLPALANCSERDPRRRTAIPAYSGKRGPVEIDIGSTTVGIDVSVLLTLSYLNALDLVLDTFEKVHVAHSTLAWLMQERERATYHQPSRIRNAHEVRDLLSRGLMEEFVPTTVPNAELSVQVGEELASLIAEAEMVSENGVQRIVVCSAPVYRLSTLMEEEADLTSYAAVLSSCLSVVEKLREKGQITGEEERRARAYFQFQERAWPNQPHISDNAILYLDNQAIGHLLNLGLLEKIRNAGLRAIASPKEISESNSLLNYERISDDVVEILERLRVALNARIEAGRIMVDRRRQNDEDGVEAIGGHPTVGLFELGTGCEALLVDDRLVNRLEGAQDGERKVPIISTLDVLDALASQGTISGDARLEFRTLLRRAGYVFVPVGEDELKQFLIASPIQDGRVIETAELKAIRESVLCVRMSDWLQFPDEGPWLDGILNGSVRVLKGLWKDGSDIKEVRARSDWIAQLINAQGWAHRMGTGHGDEFVRMGRGAHLLMFLTPPWDAGPVVRDAYWTWVEERVVVPVKEQFPELYAWLVEWHRRQISQMVQQGLSELETS